MASPVEVELANVPPVHDNSIQGKIRAKFGVNAESALAIAKCETNFNPLAVGDLGIDGGTNPSYGLFQIRYFGGARGTIEQLHDVDYNINKAYEMSGGGTNWAPWYNCAVKNGLL